MDFQTTLHEVIKARLLETQGGLTFGNGESRTRRLYYLRNLEDNLYEPMSDVHRSEYGSGSGGELEWKMSSIRSSSAMTFNLLGNGKATIKGGDLAGHYDVVYEYQLPTLENNPHPANLDAYLRGNGTDIYCEMKMLEWLNTPHHALRDAYRLGEGYFLSVEETESFTKMFRRLACVRVCGKGRKSEWLSDGRYDSLQMAKHLLAIYNRVSLDVNYRPKRIILLNCVWEMTNPEKLGKYETKYLEMLEEEHDGFSSFRDIAMREIGPLFEAYGIELDIRYISATNLMKLIVLDPAQAKFLARYIV